MTAIQRALHAFFVAAVTLVLTCGALGAAGAAWAHAALIASDPADAATLQQQPARVSATFNEPMQPQFAAMTVVGPDGAQWGDGEPAVDGTDISVAVRPGRPRTPETARSSRKSSCARVDLPGGRSRTPAIAPARCKPNATETGNRDWRSSNNRACASGLIFFDRMVTVSSSFPSADSSLKR